MEALIAALDADCSADEAVPCRYSTVQYNTVQYSTVPCSFTADIQTLATDTLEANWTSLHETKTAEAVTNILTSTFSDFGRN